MEGFLNLDKPSGPTSHDVVAQVRRLSGVRRVGHAGTLDPLATGVLVLGLGRATRLIEYLVGQPKTYLATVRLGQATNTYDAYGEILAENEVDLDREELANALEAFRGSIQQLPPMFSAVKKDGQPLYKFARRGEVVERRPREVTVYRLDLLAWKSPRLELRIVCSAGTYIRSIAHDLGQALGCGGHIAALRRTAVGAFTADLAVSLTGLTGENLPSHLQPLDVAVDHLPALSFSAGETLELQHGRRVPFRSGQPDAPLVRAYDDQGRFLGILERDGAEWQPHKIVRPAVGP